MREMDERRVRLVSVAFDHFKAFANYRVSLSDMNVLVGKNNSGKSTIIGALRALAIGLRRAHSRAPDRVHAADGAAVWLLRDDQLPLSLENVHTDYQEVDSRVTFDLSNGNRLWLLFPADGGVLLHGTGKGPVRTAADARREFPLRIGQVPVLGPIEHRERLLQLETVRRDLATHRASRQFRSYWYHCPDGFELFRSTVERTWPGMQLSRPELAGSPPEVSMFCTEHRIARELYWCGFGFQIWCQLIAHLTLSRDADLVVVDEPETYLHPDIQRQLVHLLREHRADIVVATHSSEIIAESEPHEIVIIDRTRARAQRVRETQQVQAVLTGIGSLQNITLTRLAQDKRVVFVEGSSDFPMLRRFARQIGLVDLAASTHLSVIDAGGFSWWQRIEHLLWGLERLLAAAALRVAVVLDRDFHSAVELDRVRSRLADRCEIVHIHGRKELENYLLVPSAIDAAVQRALSRRTEAKVSAVPVPPAKELLDGICSQLKTQAQAQYLAFAVREHRSREDHSTVNQRTLRWFDDEWNTLDGRLKLVSGKEVFTLLNRALADFGVSLTSTQVISQMRPNDLPSELVALLKGLQLLHAAPPS